MQRFRPHAVLARGGMQGLDARLGGAQRLGVELDARGVLAQRACGLVRLGLRGLEQLHDRNETGIMDR